VCVFEQNACSPDRGVQCCTDECVCVFEQNACSPDRGVQYWADEDSTDSRTPHPKQATYLFVLVCKRKIGMQVNPRVKSHERRVYIKCWQLDKSLN